MTSSEGPKSDESSIKPSWWSRSSDSKSRLSTKDAPRLRQNGVLDAFDSEGHPPGNRAEVERRLRRDRDTPSPPASRHRYLKEDVQAGSNEKEINHIFSSFVLRDPICDHRLWEEGYSVKLKAQWDHFPTDQGFNDGLVAPKPNRAEGYPRETFPPDIEQVELVEHEPNFVVLPHLATEFVDFGTDMRKARIRASYDGAAMVFARNEALKHIKQPDPETYAAPISVASDGLTWNVYLHHAHMNRDTQKLEYFQVRVEELRVRFL